MTGPAPLSLHVVEGLGVLRRRPERLDRPSPSVVLVHGAMDRAASFGRVMRRLGDLDVCAYDRRGYATSLGSGTAATLDAQVTDLLAVATWTGAEQVVVVGHSFGGTVGLALAASAPSVLIGLGAFESPVPSLPTYRSDGSDLALAAAEQGGPEAAAEAFYRLMVGDSTWERLRERDRLERRAEGSQLVAELLDLRRHPGAPDPDAVDVPVVVGAGARSDAAWRRSAEELARRLPLGELFEIPGASHGAHLSHPDEFARYVNRCVSSSVARRAPPAA